ncbi:hypothetical protein G7Y89_g9058 [Cudoniella acicularis]|uniref:Uncharacterized protein n=1 Tax=Cudoniella acicularis TaxID=354080 RepID=A0A8H4RFE0_9HELO|nr:hypothetical protein G7Y89_g9058 [Cudoniella acicularis]
MSAAVLEIDDWWLGDHDYIWVDIDPDTDEPTCFDDLPQSAHSFLLALDDYVVLPLWRESQQTKMREDQKPDLAGLKASSIGTESRDTETRNADETAPKRKRRAWKSRPQSGERRSRSCGRRSTRKRAADGDESDSGETCSIHTDVSWIVANGLPLPDGDSDGGWGTNSDDLIMPFAATQASDKALEKIKKDVESHEDEDEDKKHFEEIRNVDQVALAAVCTAFMVGGMWALENGSLWVEFESIVERASSNTLQHI